MIKPLADFILIKPEKPQTMTKGGIALPDTVQGDRGKPVQGVVLRVGPGHTTPEGKLIEPRVKVGDTVLYLEYTGQEVLLGEVKHKLVKESDVLGIVE